ncbi:hypothetical protein [Georgenia sp. AZ-5]|uniref:hypothetical protein n=1 Tax=Georgenia sp. AZ-5 TaxID=3367526 RepID=UPI00375491D0
MSLPRRLTAMALFLIVGGLVLAVRFPSSGWAAHQAPAEAPFVSTTAATLVMLPTQSMVVLGPAQLMGYGVTLLGVVLLAVAAGYVIGRRANPF